ncbi:YsnF/AvaK domain-containing protein [Spirosoma agri]|uniref:YsnF/AvaK domain-containing protein n=1 Tax=Spirosoma agri TaxID=1987381 RepID=A0A6M0IRW5_9BACT|nr:YsnF/AvaK domain-containing protein [Spirosoma agri]NEU70121.1 YsnF/AvaK domain-containing protein [Spirosoma agri]
MALTVIGIFDEPTQAQQAVSTLVSEGFSQNNIDISAGRSTDTTSTGDAFPDRNVNSSGTRSEELIDDAKDTGSGIGGFFRSLFGGDDDDDTNRYSTVAERGSIVTVHASSADEAERAADILDEAGAVDVDERATEYGYGTTAGKEYGYGATTSTGLANTTTTEPSQLADGDQTIKVIKEDLEVGKRTVETGGVRVRSRIVERPIEESIRLREERVVVQRNPVNRPATAADLNAFQEGEISLTEHAEVPVVSKTANVVEEISVGKDVTERDEVIHETVRNTEVDVENVGTTAQTVRPAGTLLDDDNTVTYPAK